jgi:DNA-binding transcriptional ArsR family regulator
VDEVLAFVRRRKVSVSTADVAAALGVSRQAAHRHLRKLAVAGAIVSRGAGRSSRWELASSERTFRYRAAGLAEDRVWDELARETPAISTLGATSRTIAAYAFTEMLNNAIEHSRTKTIDVRVLAAKDGVVLEIVDHGVGAFETVRSKLRLANQREALAEISKGKTTTMPKRHSGEGIFFTSKAVSRFDLDANGIVWLVDNVREDFTVETSRRERGTRVRLVVARKPKRTLRQVFDEYTVDDSFAKTRAVVRLFALGTEFVSRSEARRLLAGLERFREVVFDFARVVAIGQGFADEVFRVWRAAHPAIVISVENANDDVAFMIRRAGFVL